MGRKDNTHFIVREALGEKAGLSHMILFSSNWAKNQLKLIWERSELYLLKKE